MSEFSLPCESTSSIATHANTTASNFKVNMREPLELNDQWEVALSELQYPCAWDNVRRGNNKFLIRFRIEGVKKPYVATKKVPAGYYADTSILVPKINSLTERTAVGKLKGINLTYDLITRRVIVTTKNVKFTDKKAKEYTVNASIKLKGDVARLLGFPSDKLIIANMVTSSPFTGTPTGGVTKCMYTLT